MSETTQKDFNKMNASEKTAFLGFKIFSERELNKRQRLAEERRTNAFRKLMGDIAAIPNLRVGKHLTAQQLEEVFKDTINNFYDYAHKSGLSAGDIAATTENVIHVAYMLKRCETEANTEAMRLMFAVTGENDSSSVPLNKMAELVEAAKKVIPQNIEEDFDAIDTEQVAAAKAKEAVEQAPPLTADVAAVVEEQAQAVQETVQDAVQEEAK